MMTRPVLFFAALVLFMPWMHRLVAAEAQPRSIVGFYHFDEGQGQYASDSSPEGNSAFLGKLPEPDPRDPRWTPDGHDGGALADASAESLGEAVQAAVEPGSTVETDGWGGYGDLSELGYVHNIVREASEVGENLLRRAHRVASLLKRWLLGTYQGAVSPSHLDYYLDEYTFRFNRRTSRSRGKLFYRLVQQAAAMAPVVAKEIEGGAAPP